MRVGFVQLATGFDFLLLETSYGMISAMSIEDFVEKRSFEINRVDLYDPNKYELSSDSPLSRRTAFDDFIKGFPEFLRREAGAERNRRAQDAKELLDALAKLPDSHLADAISLSASGDWTDDTTEIDDTGTLFGVLNDLNMVLNDPPFLNKRAAEAFGDDPDSLDTSSPLAIYTRWLFQDQTLTTWHGHLWEQFISEDLAAKYVKERGVDIPEAVKYSEEYATSLLEEGFRRAENGEDSRSVGVEQLVGMMIGNLDILETGDPRYDYRRRQQIASEISDSIACGDTEEVLTILLEYIKPKDVNPQEIQGALFKPAVIKNQAGETLLAEWQSADSFWFKPPFGEHQPDEPISLFPNNPQIVKEYDHIGQSSDARIVPHKDPSYFRPDGTKVYWGDLSREDVKQIRGNYYCVAQGESYYNVPEWAIIMASPFDNDDPNRPAESLVNTEEGQVFQPDNPVYLNPDYIRAIAIGAIVNGQFIHNKRGIELEFVPNDQPENMTI